jgi:hypothetical protein
MEDQGHQVQLVHLVEVADHQVEQVQSESMQALPILQPEGLSLVEALVETGEPQVKETETLEQLPVEVAAVLYTQHQAHSLVVPVPMGRLLFHGVAQQMPGHYPEIKIFALEN